jgi:hypothetical protein
MIVRLWYSSIVELTKTARPRLFLHTNRGIRTHRPLSYSLHPKKLDIPILAPNFNLTPTFCPTLKPLRLAPCSSPCILISLKALHQSHRMTCLLFLTLAVRVQSPLTKAISFDRYIQCKMLSLFFWSEGCRSRTSHLDFSVCS